MTLTVQQIGQVRYWREGDSDWIVVAGRPGRVRVAVVGCEPERPLLGFVWLKDWQFAQAEAA